MRFEKSYGNWLPGRPNSVRFYFTVCDMACMDISLFVKFHDFAMHGNFFQLFPYFLVSMGTLGEKMGEEMETEGRKGGEKKTLPAPPPTLPCLSNDLKKYHL